MVMWSHSDMVVSCVAANILRSPRGVPCGCRVESKIKPLIQEPVEQGWIFGLNIFQTRFRISSDNWSVGTVKMLLTWAVRPTGPATTADTRFSCESRSVLIISFALEGVSCPIARPSPISTSRSIDLLSSSVTALTLPIPTRIWSGDMAIRWASP